MTSTIPRGPDPTANLPGYQAKVNLLKQIDDAASRFGGDTVSKQGGTKPNKLKELNSLRNADAKRGAQMMMQSGKGLTGKDLENVHYGPGAPGGYQHEQSIAGNSQRYGEQKLQNEDLRSLRSEFDYANKKKFTDVLTESQRGGSGLKGLEKLQNHVGKKNLDGQSLRSLGSQNSKTTSFRRRYNSIANHKDGLQAVEPIQEMEEVAVVYDKEGNAVEITQEQVDMLHQLNQQQNNVEGIQGDMLRSINLEDLRNVDVDQINKLLENTQIPFKSKTIDRTNKKMFSFNYHANSEEYKNLGNMHKDKRVVEYFPQDDRLEFSTKPQILGKQQLQSGSPSGYDFQEGGLSYTQRVPKNLVGDYLRNGRQETDQFNGRMLMDKVSIAESNAASHASMFPKTTNQDFHGGEVFAKAQTLGHQADRQNFKKNNVYSAYVNAMFNSGVFTNPWQDQC